VTEPVPVQGELDLATDYGWFHVMRPRLLKGLIAEVGETAWAVYTIIKAHANHHTGVSYPSQELIGQMIGKSTDTVARATKALVKAGLVREQLRGRHKEYVMIESAPVSLKSTGTQLADAEWQYVPKNFAGQIAALKAYILEGIPPGQGITMNLTVNLIQQRDGGTVTVNVGPDPDRANVAEAIRKLRNL
jgi:biotin operon repressor